MKPVSLPKVAFDKLSSLFRKTSGNRLLLNEGIGEGSIQFFKPEEGLRVNIWDCLFFKGIELYNANLTVDEQRSFTLAYFLDSKGQEHVQETNLFQKSLPWNCLFISDVSDFSISLAPGDRYRCVSVSFSGNWLLNVLQTNHTLQDLQDKIGRLQKLEVVQKMTPEEREIVKELFLENRQQHFRSFYIKAAVLKLVCDFLHRLRNEQPFLAKSGISATLEEVEQYLNEHITKEFTGTKVLAEQFSVSESTLKRHFQKKYGVTIAAYITSKKMQTAKSLVDEQGIKIADAALMLGYRSIQNFKEIFTKYHRCTMVKKNEQITGENISCS